MVLFSRTTEKTKNKNASMLHYLGFITGGEQVMGCPEKDSIAVRITSTF